MPGITGQPNVTPGGGISQVTADARYVALDGSTNITGDQTFEGGVSVTGATDITGTLTSNGQLIATAGISVASRTIASAAAISLTDSIVLLDASAGNLSVTLPAAGDRPGLWLEIKRIDATVNTCLVVRAGADTIDGGTSLSFAINQARALFATSATTWSIF